LKDVLVKRNHQAIFTKFFTYKYNTTMIRSILFFLIIGTVGIAQAQQPVASFNDNMELILDNSAPISESYVIDITDMEFVSAEAAEKFFRSMTDNLVNTTVDYEAKQAIVNLSLQHVEEKGWGVDDWNAYFRTTAARYARMLNTFNNL